MYILAIDQGTTSTRVVLYDHLLNTINISQKTVEQIYPQKGWLEHNAENIFEDIIYLIKNCVAEAAKKLQTYQEDLFKQIQALGITNQRETTVVWDKITGKPIHNAIVWQDRRTSDYCKQLKSSHPGLEKTIQQKTGLIIDPYFSASKINWLLSEYNLYNNKNILFGTIDSFIIYKLTNGQTHATDITNASRTQVYNINTLKWDQELLDIYQIPNRILPEVRDCDSLYGHTNKNLFGVEIPITGVAGDQQSAAIGQLCTNPKEAKITYGTGCFVLENTGSTKVESNYRLISTIAYRINNNLSYALEGSIFVAGAAIQWLRDTLKIITKAEDSETIAKRLTDTNGVYLVPAFTGLGAPYWDPEARGAILGLTRESSSEHIVRAALESVCYQTHDLLNAFSSDFYLPHTIRVDGGMSANNWFLQFLANITQTNIQKPNDIETTVRGAAILAGLGANLYSGIDKLPFNYKTERQFTPDIDITHSEDLYKGWQEAVARVKSVN